MTTKTDELAELRGQRRHEQQHAIVREYQQHMAAEIAGLEAEIPALEAHQKTLGPALAALDKKYGNPAPEDWPKHVQRTWEDRRRTIQGAQRTLEDNPSRCRALLDKIRDGENRRGVGYLKTWAMEPVVHGDRSQAGALIGGAAGLDGVLAHIETLTALHDEAYQQALAAERIDQGGRIELPSAPVLASEAARLQGHAISKTAREEWR